MQLLWGLLHRTDEDAATKSRFEIAIDEMAEKNGSVVMGRVHLINLGDLITRRKTPDSNYSLRTVLTAASTDRLQGRDGSSFATKSGQSLGNL